MWFLIHAGIKVVDGSLCAVCLFVAKWRHMAPMNQAIIASSNAPVTNSHYLNQCWRIEIANANWTHRNNIQWNLIPNTQIFSQENAFQIVVCKLVAIN